jgi:hypothetical protein
MQSYGLDLNSAYPPMNETPKSIYGFQTHNLYKDVPPFMNDGRVLVASWQQESVTNNNLLKATGMHSNWEFRRYLTQNAKSIIQKDQAESLNDIGYIARYSTAPEQANTVPYYYKSYLDNTQPFGYQSSDLKQLYLTAEQLNARKMAPVITQTHLAANANNSN